MTHPAQAVLAADRPRPGRASKGAGSVVSRVLTDGRTVYDVSWTCVADDGTQERAAARGLATTKEAEKHRRAMTSTVDPGLFVTPQDTTAAGHLAEWVERSCGRCAGCDAARRTSHRARHHLACAGEVA